MTVRHLYLGEDDESDNDDDFDDHCHDDVDDADDDNKPEHPSQRKAMSPPSIESQIIRGR